MSVSGNTADEAAAAEEERLMRIMTRGPGATPKARVSAKTKQPAAAAAAPASAKTPAGDGKMPEWKRLQMQREKEKMEQLLKEEERKKEILERLKQQAAARQEGGGGDGESGIDRGSQYVPSGSAPSSARSSAARAATESPGGVDTSSIQRMDGEDVAANEEDRLMRHLTGKTPRRLANMPSGGGDDDDDGGEFDADALRGALAAEVSSVREKPKFYVKKLLKLKKAYTGKDLVLPSRPDYSVRTKEGAKAVTTAILWLSGEARARSAVSDADPALAEVCQALCDEQLGRDGEPIDSEALLARFAAAGGWNGRLHVTITYGIGQADELVPMWMIDDGRDEDERPARAAVFVPDWRVIGVGCARCSGGPAVAVAFADKFEAGGAPSDGASLTVECTVYKGAEALLSPRMRLQQQQKKQPSRAKPAAAAPAADDTAAAERRAAEQRAREEAQRKAREQEKQKEEEAAAAAAARKRAAEQAEQERKVREAQRAMEEATEKVREESERLAKKKAEEAAAAEEEADEAEKEDPALAEAEAALAAKQAKVAAAAKARVQVRKSKEPSKEALSESGGGKARTESQLARQKPVPTPKKATSERVTHRADVESDEHGASELTENADGTAYVVDQPTTAKRENLKLLMKGDSIKFVEAFPEEKESVTHVWRMPRVYDASRVTAKFTGDSVVVTIPKDAAEGDAGAVDESLVGELCRFETEPDESAPKESIVLKATQNTKEIVVRITASTSKEKVCVSFKDGALEVEAKRSVIEREADSSKVRVTKSVYETLKIPFAPAGITHEMLDDNAGVVVHIAKPARQDTTDRPEVEIAIEAAE